MTIFFERGPQKDESKRFQMSPKIRKTSINEVFQRNSTFYLDKKNGGWYEK